MSESAEILNPNQVFKGAAAIPQPVIRDGNPNEIFKSTEGLREPYSMQFGDVIKFEH